MNERRHHLQMSIVVPSAIQSALIILMNHKYQQQTSELMKQTDEVSSIHVTFNLQSLVITQPSKLTRYKLRISVPPYPHQQNTFILPALNYQQNYSNQDRQSELKAQVLLIKSNGVEEEIGRAEIYLNQFIKQEGTIEIKDVITGSKDFNEGETIAKFHYKIKTKFIYKGLSNRPYNRKRIQSQKHTLDIGKQEIKVNLNKKHITASLKYQTSQISRKLQQLTHEVQTTANLDKSRLSRILQKNESLLNELRYDQMWYRYTEKYLYLISKIVDRDQNRAYIPKIYQKIQIQIKNIQIINQNDENQSVFTGLIEFNQIVQLKGKYYEYEREILSIIMKIQYNHSNTQIRWKTFPFPLTHHTIQCRFTENVGERRVLIGNIKILSFGNQMISLYDKNNHQRGYLSLKISKKNNVDEDQIDEYTKQIQGFRQNYIQFTKYQSLPTSFNQTLTENMIGRTNQFSKRVKTEDFHKNNTQNLSRKVYRFKLTQLNQERPNLSQFRQRIIQRYVGKRALSLNEESTQKDEDSRNFKNKTEFGKIKKIKLFGINEPKLVNLTIDKIYLNLSKQIDHQKFLRIEINSDKYETILLRGSQNVIWKNLNIEFKSIRAQKKLNISCNFIRNNRSRIIIGITEIPLKQLLSSRRQSYTATLFNQNQKIGTLIIFLNIEEQGNSPKKMFKYQRQTRSSKSSSKNEYSSILPAIESISGQETVEQQNYSNQSGAP